MRIGSTCRGHDAHPRLADGSQAQGSGEMPDWAKWMAARHRKTLVVCRKCHEATHVGSTVRHARPLVKAG
jgi:AI2M/AI1M-like, HNH endonuclease